MTRDKSIGWAEETWNPCTGCDRGCPYCYARDQHHRFEKKWGYDFTPQIHKERFDDPFHWRKSRRVFVGSMGEIFALKDDSIWELLDIMANCYQHKFLILTKMSERLKDFVYPWNVWVGVTVTGAQDEGRIFDLVQLKRIKVKYVSFEPLLYNCRNDLDLCGIDWVIIGGCRRISYPKPFPKFVPPREWVEPIIAEARRVGAAIFLKNNLEWPESIREWPEKDDSA